MIAILARPYCPPALEVSAGLAVALEQAIDATWVAGTSHGISLLPTKAAAWRPKSSTVVNEQGTVRRIPANPR